MQHVKLIFLGLLAITTQVTAQTFKTRIKGVVNNPEVNKVIITYTEDNVETKDSFQVKSGKFAFTKNFKVPTVVKLSTNKKKIAVDLFAENGVYDLAINKEGVGINHAPATQSQFDQFVDLDKVKFSLFPLYDKLWQAKDSIGLAKLSQTFDSINAVSVAKAKKLFLADPTSPISFFLFQKFASDGDYSDKLNAFNALPLWAKESDRGKTLKTVIEGALRTKIGNVAPLFSSKDSAGNTVSLKDFKGKYTLIDFWASWCKPCREENPNLIRLFNQYQNKNFAILGVALENANARAAWLRAIADDKLIWTNVTDFKFFKSPVAILYGVQAIPVNFLVDPEGKIIAKNLRGEELNNKLREIFNN